MENYSNNATLFQNNKTEQNRTAFIFHINNIILTRLLLFIMILICKDIIGQSSFIKTIDFYANKDDQATIIIKKLDTIYVLNGEIYDYRSRFSKFDVQGKFKSGKDFDDFIPDSHSKLFVNDTMHILGRSYDFPTGDTLLFYIFKLNGDSISTNKVTDASRKYLSPNPNALLKLGDQYIIVATCQLSSNEDSILNIGTIWYVNSDFTVDTIIPISLDYNTISYDAHIGPDGLLYVFNFMECGFDCDLNYRRKAILKYNGKERVDVNYSEWYSLDFQKPRITLVTSDTTFIYGFAQKWDGDKPSIRCVDFSGNILWENADHLWTDTKYYTNIKELGSGDFLTVGYINNAFIGTFNFLRTSFIQKIDKKGNTVWEKIIGMYNGTNPTAAESYLWDFAEDEDGGLYFVGQMAGETKDMLLIKTDSFGCIDQDRCNDHYVIHPLGGLHQYDQIDMKHKQWYYTIRDASGISHVEDLTFGKDTLMFDKLFGIRKYKEVITSLNDNLIDTIKVRWNIEGKLHYMPRQNPNIWEYIVRDSVLYDFTLTQGDKFQLPRGFGLATVSKVDSVTLLDGKTRKRMILKHDNIINQNKYGNLIWIEGIGSTNGLFYFYDWINGTHTSINCYYDRNVKRWGESEECDEVVTGFHHSYIDTLSLWRNGTVGNYAPIPFRTKFSSTTVHLDGKDYYQKLENLTENGDQWKIKENYYYREDNNKVYERIFFGEHLYLDFSLMVGDTFHDIRYDLVVVNRDSVLLFDNTKRLRMTLRCIELGGEEFQWIEGVGRLDEGVYCEIDGYESQVYCYNYDGTLLYMNPYQNNCWTTATNETLSNSNITFFPNPTTGLVTIDSDLSYDNITIYGPDGRKIKQDIGEIKQLDLSSYPNGLYSVRFTKGIEWVMIRVMKVE